MKNLSVKASSATKLSNDQLSKIKQAVEKKYPDTKVLVEAKVDKSLIGGIKLHIQTVEYDASIQGKLNQLRTHLLENL